MEEQPPAAPVEVTDDPERTEFMADLFAFFKDRGTPITKVPQLGHREIDLHMLYKQVTARGGVQKVIENKLWKEVGQYFQFPPTCTNSSFILRVNYLGFLYYYEQVKFWGITDPPPPPVRLLASLEHLVTLFKTSLGPVPNRKDFPLPQGASSPRGRRRAREEVKDEPEEEEVEDDDTDAEADEASQSAVKSIVASPTVAPEPAPQPIEKVARRAPPPQPLTMPIFTPLANAPLGATVKSVRTGLEPLSYALQNGPEFMREWAVQVLLQLSLTSDLRLSQAPGLLAALTTRLRAELERLTGEDLGSQGFSVGFQGRQMAQRLSTILRNVALIPEADADVASLQPCVALLLQILDCPDDLVRENALEAVASIAPFLSEAEVASALPHLIRALRTAGRDSETFLHALVQLSVSPRLPPLLLINDLWRSDLVAVLAEFLSSPNPFFVLLAIQILYNLSVAGGTSAIAQNGSIVKQLTSFVSMEVRGLRKQEEIARKAALLLFNFSKTPGLWHIELRRHEEDFVTGAFTLGATSTASILMNLVYNLAN